MLLRRVFNETREDEMTINEKTSVEGQSDNPQQWLHFHDRFDP